MIAAGQVVMCVVAASSLLGAISTSAARTVGPAAQPTDSDPASASDWLVVAATRRGQGDYAGAGEAQANALEAMSGPGQGGAEGARAAMLAADDYSRAFDLDIDLAHLEAGVAVLERWLELTGPDSQSSSVVDVEGKLEQLRIIIDRLAQARVAATEGRLDRATKLYGEVLVKLEQRPWAVGARITLEIASEHVRAYDRSAIEDADVEIHRSKLETARSLLEDWQSRRPSDDDSHEAGDIQQLLRELETRREDAGRRLAELAEQRRASAAAREERLRRETLDAERAARSRREAEQARKNRRQSVVLLVLGVSSMGAGAGLLGDGIVFNTEAQRVVRAEQAEAQQLAQMHGDDFDQGAFDASVSAYEQWARTRTTAQSVSGSVIMAGGAAASIVGIVGLVRNPRGQGPARRAWLVPSVARTQLGLSLSTRF